MQERVPGRCNSCWEGFVEYYLCHRRYRTCQRPIFAFLSVFVPFSLCWLLHHTLCPDEPSFAGNVLHLCCPDNLAISSVQPDPLCTRTPKSSVHKQKLCFDGLENNSSPQRIERSPQLSRCALKIMLYLPLIPLLQLRIPQTTPPVPPFLLIQPSILSQSSSAMPSPIHPDHSRTAPLFHLAASTASCCDRDRRAFLAPSTRICLAGLANLDHQVRLLLYC